MSDQHKTHTPQCVICSENIQTGEKRLPSGSGPIHGECYIPPSPLPQLAEAEYPHWIAFDTKNHHVEGHITGAVPTNEPARGFGVYVEAEKWDGLPTDQVWVIHRRKRGSWEGVYAFVDDMEYNDETDEFESNWQPLGKVRDMDVKEWDEPREGL